MVPTVAQRAGILVRLRHETRTAHQLLEQKLDLLRPDLTRTDYQSLLLRFYSIHLGWQSCVDRVLSPSYGTIAEDRCHLSRLIADLRHFGLQPAGPAVDFSCIETVAAALGCMYVLEGSTLGSQILSRNFEQRFGIQRDSGGAYFYGYGDRTGSMWKHFGAQLEHWHTEHETSGDLVVVAPDWMLRIAVETLTGENA